MTFEDLEEYGSYVSKVKDARMGYLRRLREATGKPLLELTAKEINDWISGLGLAVKTQQLVVFYVKHALKYLNGGEEYPPVCSQIRREEGGLTPRVKSPNELLTDEEVERLYLVAHRPDLKALIALHRATGARPSEVLNLPREDIAIKSENGLPFLEAVFTKTKTQWPRTVVTPRPDAIRFMEDWFKLHDGTDFYRS